MTNENNLLVYNVDVLYCTVLYSILFYCIIGRVSALSTFNQGEEEEDDTQTSQEDKEEVRPGKLRLSFEELERQRVEGVRKKAEEEAKRRMEEERRAFAKARKSMVSRLEQSIQIDCGSQTFLAAQHLLQKPPVLMSNL